MTWIDTWSHGATFPRIEDMRIPQRISATQIGFMSIDVGQTTQGGVMFTVVEQMEDSILLIKALYTRSKQKKYPLSHA